MEDIMSWLRCKVGKDLKLVEYPERLPSASLQGNLKGYPEYPQRPTVLVILHQNCICRTRAWAAPVKTALASSLLNSLSSWWCILLISIKYKYKFYSTCVCSRPPRLMFSVLLGWCTQTMIVINGFFSSYLDIELGVLIIRTIVPPDHHYQLSVESIKFSPTHWSSLAFSREGFHRYLGLAQCAFWQQLYFQTRYLSNIIQLWIHACA